jgi:DNA-binding NarL/FixJ family response regulator
MARNVPVRLPVRVPGSVVRAALWSPCDYGQQYLTEGDHSPFTTYFMGRRAVQGLDAPNVTDGPEEGFPALTARELSILRLVAEGCTNIQIADRLCISKHTVAQHIAAMLRRTSTSNRTQLVLRAYVAGALSRAG